MKLLDLLEITDKKFWIITGFWREFILSGMVPGHLLSQCLPSLKCWDYVQVMYADLWWDMTPKIFCLYVDVHDDVIKWKHFPCHWRLVRGIHWSSVDCPHKGQSRGALMFSLVCARTNGWTNNRDAVDLRRHRAYYDVTVMSTRIPLWRNYIWKSHQQNGGHFVQASTYQLMIWMINKVIGGCFVLLIMGLDDWYWIIAWLPAKSPRVTSYDQCQQHPPGRLIFHEGRSLQFWVDSSWWRHDMEMSSALLALCAPGESTGGFPSRRTSNAELSCFLRHYSEKFLNKQASCWWFKTPWRYCDITVQVSVWSVLQVISPQS